MTLKEIIARIDTSKPSEKFYSVESLAVMFVVKILW